MTEVVYVYKILLIYINFSFNFLSQNNLIFFRIFDEYGRLHSRPCSVSDIQSLAFCSSLYIRYNTAAHVVNVANTFRVYSFNVLKPEEYNC